MSLYTLAAPVEAVRYKRGVNEQEVALIVRGKSGRASFSTQQRFLHFYNDGPGFVVHDGGWVARVATSALVVPDDIFTEHFTTG